MTHPPKTGSFKKIQGSGNANVDPPVLSSPVLILFRFVTRPLRLQCILPSPCLVLMDKYDFPFFFREMCDVEFTDLEYTVQCSLVQRSSSLVHHACPDNIHRIGGQSSRQATDKTGPGGDNSIEIQTIILRSFAVMLCNVFACCH